MIRDRETASVAILLAEDDPGDRLLTVKALKRASLINRIHTVGDGRQLLDCLRGEGAFAEAGRLAGPVLVLLDLNMPKTDGRAALSEIRADPELRGIPVFALIASREEETILRSHGLEADAFITRPVTFESLAEAIGGIEAYGVELVRSSAPRSVSSRHG